MTSTLDTPASPRITGAVNHTGRHRSTRPRTFNLIDLENLVAGRVNPVSVNEAWSEFTAAIDARHTDLTTVAVSRRNAAAAFFSLPANLQRVVGANCPDGADIALIASVDIDWVVANFGQVIIGSGDHIFAPLARRFRSAGLNVVQVIGRGACSASLYRACNEQRYLNPAYDHSRRSA